jgi:pyrrolysine biosynthesis protein PylC
MRLAVVGGGLQGTEAVYLAGKAGWEVRLLDRREEVPARALAQEFVRCDASDPSAMDRVLRGVDLVLPALEDTPVLENLARWAAASGVPLAFDLAAYAISSSKLVSNRLFRRMGLELPREGPACGLPLLVKPDGLSGSRGVQVFRDWEAWRSWRDGLQDPGNWVVQEYLLGPSYSIEVLGRPEGYQALQVTELEMDGVHDCKRVRAPANLDRALSGEFGRIAAELAAAVQLHGLMDVEVILNDGRLKLLEIDARLPSQTPIAVYWSTGYNMVRSLGKLFLHGEAPDPLPSPGRAVVLEHLHAAGNRLEVAGEHVMSRRAPLRLEKGFYGAEEALTDLWPGRSDWAATLIVTGADREEAWRRRCLTVEAIRGSLGLTDCADPEPLL